MKDLRGLESTQSEWFYGGSTEASMMLKKQAKFTFEAQTRVRDTQR